MIAITINRSKWCWLLIMNAVKELLWFLNTFELFSLQSVMELIYYCWLICTGIFLNILYNLKISENKSKVLAMRTKYLVRTIIVVNEIILEQFRISKCLDNRISVIERNENLEGIIIEVMQYWSETFIWKGSPTEIS